MSTDAITPAPFQQLVELLEGAGVQASLDPADLNVPAVWIALDSVAQANLAGRLELRCLLFLIVGDADTTRAMASLGQLHAKVLQVITPDGPVVTQGVVMPGDPTPLPALRVPVNLYTTTDDDTGGIRPPIT